MIDDDDSADDAENMTVVVDASYLADLTEDPTTPFEPTDLETTPFEREPEVVACNVGDGVVLSAEYMQRITDALRAERERRLDRNFT